MCHHLVICFPIVKKKTSWRLVFVPFQNFMASFLITISEKTYSIKKVFCYINYYSRVGLLANASCQLLNNIHVQAIICIISQIVPYSCLVKCLRVGKKIVMNGFMGIKKKCWNDIVSPCCYLCHFDLGKDNQDGFEFEVWNTTNYQVA